MSLGYRVKQGTFMVPLYKKEHKHSVFIDKEAAVEKLNKLFFKEPKTRMRD